MKALREQRRKLVEDQRTLVNAADAEQRAMSDDEMAQFDKIDTAINNLKNTIERGEGLPTVEAAPVATDDLRVSFEPLETRTPATMTMSVAVQSGAGSDHYRSAFEGYLRRGVNGLTGDEQRALSEGTDSAGGYLVPNQWNDEIVKKLDEENVMRRLSTVITTETGTFNIPVVTTQGTAAWTAEAASLTESDSVFGNYSMSAFKAARIMKVSRELLADNRFDLVSYITEEFSRSVNVLAEAAYVDGSGSGQPEGIIYNSTVGVTAAGATAITADELIGLFHALKPQYRLRTSTAWLMADATIKAVRQLKDTTNQYLWQPGLRDGDPDRLLGKPVYASSHCPAMISGGKSVVFADFSFFYIGDRQGIEMQRLTELYAATGQDGFIGTMRTDSTLTNTEASQVLQQA